MKKLNDILTPEVQKALTGLYVITDENGCAPIIEAQELTADNFGLIVNDVIFTVDDFQWYDEDGSDRDFSYDGKISFLESYSMPDEVRNLLNATICMKFAIRHIDNAKSVLDLASDNDDKSAITDAIADFEKSTDSKEKLETAQIALHLCAEIFEKIDSEISSEFDEASDVIRDVLTEIKNMM